MTGAMLAAVLALGINSGWEKQPDGSLEYVIQIDPQTLDLLKKGEPIGSDIPPDVRGVRSYRIEVGNGPLRRDAPPEETSSAKPAVTLIGGVEPSQLPSDAFRPPGEPPGAPAPKEAELVATAKTDTATTSNAIPPQPWMPLTLAAAGLLASVGGNLYLGWLIWEMRGRFRRLLHRSGG